MIWKTNVRPLKLCCISCPLFPWHCPYCYHPRAALSLIPRRLVVLYFSGFYTYPSEYNHSVSIHDLFISINLLIVPFLYPGCFRGGFLNGLIPEFFPACECPPASFILEWRFAWVSYSWVMFSCPQRKLHMHFSTVLGHWLSLWEAGGQPDISFSCKHFVSSAQMPEQSLSWSQHLNKDMSWCPYVCMSGNSLAPYGIHPPFLLLGFSTSGTLVHPAAIFVFPMYEFLPNYFHRYSLDFSPVFLSWQSLHLAASILFLTIYSLALKLCCFGSQFVYWGLGSLFSSYSVVYHFIFESCFNKCMFLLSHSIAWGHWGISFCSLSYVVSWVGVTGGMPSISTCGRERMKGGVSSGRRSAAMRSQCLS